MKRTATSELSEGPTQYRRQHTPFSRDVLTPLGAPVVARHRARTILTPLEVRRAIIEDAASKPETVRLRSLRRRLTILDRTLTDREAETLEKLTSSLNALSNAGSINYLRSEVRSTSYDRIPFSERRRREIAYTAYVLKGLCAANRIAILRLAELVDASYSGAFKPDDGFIASIRTAAAAAADLLDEWLRKEKRPKVLYS